MFEYMDTPMPETSSKLANLDYFSFFKKDSMHLACPDCDTYPALIVSKDAKNLFYVSASCQNNHLKKNIQIKEFLEKYSKQNVTNEKEFISTCQEHKLKYESFCKSCGTNMCPNCENKHVNHNITKFNEIVINNEEIQLLKDSIKNERKITSEFLNLEFNRWINELQK